MNPMNQYFTSLTAHEQDAFNSLWVIIVEQTDPRFRPALEEHFKPMAMMMFYEGARARQLTWEDRT
jgi:hypothetical protein